MDRRSCIEIEKRRTGNEEGLDVPAKKKTMSARGSRRHWMRVGAKAIGLRNE